MSKQIAVQALKVRQVIPVGDDDTMTISSKWKKGLTPYALLVRASKKKRHSIRFSATFTSIGVLITEIEGLAGVPGVSCLMYTVNGELPDVGCDEYLLEPDDTVNWVRVPFVAKLAQS